jgi:HD-GYP domain-containing protein (c-di-GMP phosphodiesterase class II)
MNIRKSNRLSKDQIKELNKILLNISAVVKNRQIYPPEHPNFKELFTKLFTSLQEQIRLYNSITFKFLENQVIIQNIPQYEINNVLRAFIQSCQNRNFQGITFLKDLNINELLGLIEVISMDIEELEKNGGIQKELNSRKIIHITLDRLDPIKRIRETTKQAIEIYSSGIIQMKTAMKDASLGKPITNIEPIRVLMGDMINSLIYRKSTLLGLTAVKDYDEYTFCHSLNVGILSLCLGIHISLPNDMLETLGIGGFLHDIGKVSIPKSILNKPGNLSNYEWDIMHKHPINGAQIIQNTPELKDYASVVAFEHHIKYDFSGYPQLSRNRPLSIYSMAVGIADCYDAMTTERPYKKPWTQSDAIKKMVDLGGQDFEPRLMSMFAEVIGIYPIGSFLLLDTNEYAVVYDISEDTQRPVIKIVINNQGKKLNPSEITDLRIKNPYTGHYQRSITQTLNPASMGINVADYLK